MGEEVVFRRRKNPYTTVIAAILSVLMLTLCLPAPVRADSGAAPQAPYSVYATKKNTSVTLTWKNPRANKNIEEYVITYANLDTDTGKTYRKETNSAVTKFVVPGLTPATNYRFSVQAKDNKGNLSVPSEPLSVKTSGTKKTAAQSETKHFGVLFGALDNALHTWADNSINWLESKTSDKGSNLKWAVGATAGVTKALTGAVGDLAGFVGDSLDFALKVHPLTNAQGYVDTSKKLWGGLKSSVKKVKNDPQTHLVLPLKLTQWKETHPLTVKAKTALTIGGVSALGTVVGTQALWNSVKETYRQYELSNPFNKGKMAGIAAGGIAVLAVGPKNPQKGQKVVRTVEVAIDGGKNKVVLGTIEDGVTKLSDDLMSTLDLRKLTDYIEIAGKRPEIAGLIDEVMELDSDIVKKYNRGIITKEEAEGSFYIMEKTLKNLDDFSQKLQAEADHIFYTDALSLEKLSPTELKLFKKDISSLLEELRIAPGVSPALISANERLLERIKIAQLPKINTISESMMNAPLDLREVLTYPELLKLKDALVEETRFFSQAAKTLKPLKHDESLQLLRKQYKAALSEDVEFLAWTKGFLVKEEMDLFRVTTAKSLLDKDLASRFNLKGLEVLEKQVSEDLLDLSRSRISDRNRKQYTKIFEKLLDNIKVAKGTLQPGAAGSLSVSNTLSALMAGKYKLSSHLTNAFSYKELGLLERQLKEENAILMNEARKISKQLDDDVLPKDSNLNNQFRQILETYWRQRDLTDTVSLTRQKMGGELKESNWKDLVYELGIEKSLKRLDGETAARVINDKGLLSDPSRFLRGKNVEKLSGAELLEYEGVGKKLLEHLDKQKGEIFAKTRSNEITVEKALELLTKVQEDEKYIIKKIYELEDALL